MMPKPPQASSSRVGRIPSLVIAVLAASTLQCLVAVTGFATDTIDPASVGPRMGRSGLGQGLTILDLPLQFRAQFDATYTRSLYASDILATPHVNEFGPSLRDDHSLQSHFELTRFLSDRIEIGIVWGGRSRISETDFLDFGRQTVGAMIRFIP
jgi:hypothetical protein